jgi:4a-hydroxytetrahydrobiopterin dehydratase
MRPEQISPLLRQLDGWSAPGNDHLSKTYRFEEFTDGLAFVNKVAAVAEEEGHHPDVHLSWGKVQLDVSTHSIGGLSENDFILAAKCDRVYARR